MAVVIAGAIVKALGLGLLAALAFAGVAFADDEAVSNQAWVFPKFEVVHDRWPKQDDGTILYGAVTLDCAATPNTVPADCRVKSSKPHDPRLETAALSLTPLFKAGPKTNGRTPLVIDVMYDTFPGWLRKPSFQEMALAWPHAAGLASRGGWGVVKCTVNTQGLLQNCSVQRESTPPLGFGAAALKLTPTFLFKPAMRNGQPVEGEVTIPVDFPDGFQGLPNAVVLPAPNWAQTPDVKEILDQLDKKVGDKFADGKVVFMCKLDKKTGKVGGCVVANASEGMTQFRGVANTLSDTFQADPKAMADIRSSLDPTHTDAYIFLPFSFPDMSSPAWSKRYVTHVQWVRTLDRGAELALYPDQAVKAGVKEGNATVDCLISADGTLSDCLVKSESTPGVGFGEMAKKVAEASVANRWTEEGLPVEGARVILPIKMAYDDKAPAPTPATKP